MLTGERRIIRCLSPGFPEFLPSVGTTRFKTMLKTSDRIDKDAGHQPHDRLDRSRTTPRGVKLCGHNGIGAKRKFIACGTRRIDSDTWIAHESPTFAAFWRGTTPTRGHVSLGEGDRKRCSDRVGDFFGHNFRSQPSTRAGVKNDRTTACALTNIMRRLRASS